MSGLSLDALTAWGPALLERVYGRPHAWTDDGGYATPSAWWDALAGSIREELRAPDDLPAAVHFAFAEDVPLAAQAADALGGACAPDILSDFVSRLERLGSAEPEAVKRLFQELRSAFRERHGIRGRDVMFVVRSALTGRVQGPCLEVVVCLLGRRRCAERARRQLKSLVGDSV